MGLNNNSKFTRLEVIVLILCAIIGIIILIGMLSYPFYHHDKVNPPLELPKEKEFNNPFLDQILEKYKDFDNTNNNQKQELECLALNIYHEARGESRVGRLLVGHVTLNRVESKLFPDSICEVVYDDWQFSWVRLIKNHEPKDKEAYEEILELSKLLLNRDFDRSEGSLFYLNPKKVNKLPRWVNVYTKVKEYKNHVFYTTSRL